MGDKRVVAEWMMTPVPGYECKATFFEDGTAEFFNEAARRREYDRGSGVRRLLFNMFAEEDRHLADEVCRHTYNFRIHIDLLSRIRAAYADLKISDAGEVESNITPAVEHEIDLLLNGIFWRDITPRLHEPLERNPNSR